MANYETQDLQYLQMMQENITRMAGNSANAKTWLVTIVTGFFAIGCTAVRRNYYHNVSCSTASVSGTLTGSVG